MIYIRESEFSEDLEWFCKGNQENRLWDIVKGYKNGLGNTEVRIGRIIEKLKEY